MRRVELGQALLFFPYTHINQVADYDLRDKLVDFFDRWGKCGSMRVDNGEPLGSSRNDTTSALSLWLIANDIDMIFNRPARPQSNGKVERIQGLQHVGQKYIELRT